jgi:hypothetical protein
MNVDTRVNTGKNVIATEYSIGQRVNIAAIDTPGVVKSITITKEGIEFFVAYFDDDKVRRAEWLDASELSRV